LLYRQTALTRSIAQVGLLHDRSLMAHCTHVSSADLARLSRTGTAVSHCPLSNVYFSAERQLPLREAWQAGVKVGLGSDISGGYRVGLDENMRWAVGISRLRQGQGQHLNAAEQGNNSVAITWQEALYLATLGGAQALGLDRERNVGTLEVGSAFDAQWIRVGGKGSRVEWFDLPDQDGQIKAVSVEEKLERWWCNGSEADRKAVWVQGRRVYTQET
jgi:guanine deaminase